MHGTATLSDQSNPDNALNPDETSNSVAGPGDTSLSMAKANELIG